MSRTWLAGTNGSVKPINVEVDACKCGLDASRRGGADSQPSSVGRMCARARFGAAGGGGEAGRLDMSLGEYRGEGKGK
jgi:hypothetical protein